MTLQLAQGIPFPAPLIPAGAAYRTLGSSTAKLGNIVQAPKTGSLTHILVRTGTAAISSMTIRVRIETVSLGLPTGTLVATGAEGTITSPATSTTYEVALGTALSVTQGQVFAILMDVSAYVNSSTNFLMVNQTAVSSNFPYLVAATTGAYSKTTSLYESATAMKIDGAWVFHPGLWPISNTNNATVTSSSTPNEQGNRYLLPFATRVSGIWFGSHVGNSAPWVATIYDLAGTVLASITWAEGEANRGYSAIMQYARLDADLDLAAGAEGRITVKPTTTTGFPFPQYDINSSAHAAALPDAGNWQKTSRTGAGAWTDVPLSRMSCGLMLSAFGNDTNNRKVLTGAGWVTA